MPKRVERHLQPEKKRVRRVRNAITSNSIIANLPVQVVGLLMDIWFANILFKYLKLAFLCIMSESATPLNGEPFSQLVHKSCCTARFPRLLPLIFDTLYITYNISIGEVYWGNFKIINFWSRKKVCEYCYTIKKNVRILSRKWQKIYIFLHLHINIWNKLDEGNGRR